MKLLIIEDEPAAAKRLKNLVLEVRPETEILNIIDSIEDAVAYFKNNPDPDGVLCDIELADGQCFEIFRQTEVTAPVIFTTAYDQYAIQAFQVNSIDYLLKPVKKEELVRSFEKLDKWKSRDTPPIDYSKLAAMIKNEEKDYNKRFLIRYGQNIKAVDVYEVAYFYTEEKSIFIRTFEGKTFTIDESLDKLEDLLDPRQFFRINRQMIVNIDAINEMFAYSKSRVKLKLDPAYGDGIIVSTDRSPKFKRWLAKEQD